MNTQSDWDADGFDVIYQDLGLYRTHLDWIRNQPALAGLPPAVLEQIAHYRESLAKGKLVSWMNLQDGDLVLDNGCGIGYFIFDIMQAFPHRTLAFAGIDVSHAGLKLLEKRCDIESKQNVLGLVGDIAGLPFDDNTFAHVVCSEVLDHAPDPAAALKEMARVLRPGGLLLVTVPNGRGMAFWDGLRAWARKLLCKPAHGEDYFEEYLAVADVRRWVRQAGLVMVHDELNTALPLATMVRIWPRPLQGVMCRLLLDLEPHLRSEAFAMNYVFAARKT